MKQKGLTINLLKDSLQQKEDVNESLRNQTPYILWSAYDRIDIKETQSFHEYFEHSFHPKEWIGDVQSLYLYPFFEEWDSQLHISMQDVSKGLFYLDNCNSPYLFFSFVTVKINEDIAINNDLDTDKELMKAVLKCFLRLIDPMDIEIKAFRSIGTEDVVFLLLGNKISDIIKSVYLLRSIKIYSDEKEMLFCSTTYSVMGQNYIDADCLSKLKKDSDACAQVLLTLKEGKRAQDFIKYVPKDFNNLISKTKSVNGNPFVEMRIGEYDIQFVAPASKIFLRQYLDEEILNATSKEYREYILNSKTIWYLTDNALPPINEDKSVIYFNLKKNENNEEDIGVRDAIKELKCTVKDLKDKIIIEEKKSKGTQINKTNYNLIAVYQDIILFINELVKIMCSCSHSEWRIYIKRIAVAFNAGVGYYLKTLVGDPSVVELKKESFETKVLEINEILADLRNALSHIHKSGEHFYNVPHPSIYYSGSAHKVLMAYYNFIELVLSLGYLKPHSANTKQSAISFFITFGMTNKVKTNIHFKSTCTTANRLVSFQLPYAALYDFKKYFPAILHEVYHLIAPTDRRYRNKLLLDLWINMQLSQYIKAYIEQFIDTTENTKVLDDAEAATLFPEFIKHALAQMLSKAFMCEESKVFEIGLQEINNYYFSKIDSVSENVLDLDQIDFIQLLSNYFGSKEISIYIRKCFGLVDTFCSNANCMARLKKYIEQSDYATEYEEKVREICTQIADPTYSYLNKKISDIDISCTMAEKYSAGLKEVVCDLFLIDLLKWDLNDYLKYMLTLFNENGIPWTDIKSKEISVRIGTIIGFFYKTKRDNENDLDKDFDEVAPEVWIKQQLDDEISDVDKLSLIECFASYLNLYDEFFISFLPLLKTESIGEIKAQIECKRNRMDFKEKAKMINRIYYQLSSAPFSEQINGILGLQVSMHSVPMNCQLRHAISDELKNDSYIIDERTVSGDLGQFLNEILEIKRIFHDTKEELWYRGVCDMDYDLLPSLYRSLYKISGKLGDKFTPYGYQSIMMRQAYFQTKTQYSLMANNELPLAVRHSFLQHYGIRTNFLDFSTNPLVALYWALNPDDPNDANKQCDAAVYVFSPTKYQRAINKIQKEYIGLNSFDANYLYPYHSHNCLGDEYVVREMTDEEIFKKNKEAKKFQNRVNLKERLKYKKLPLATIVPQKNDRVLAQEGCFVAYNLLSAYDPSKKDTPFDYLTLQSIQNEYFKICKKKNEQPHRFLYRIVIPIMYKEKMKEALTMAFGYSLSKVYPNVDTLFKEALKEVDKYFE